jgi:cytochrome c oxidase subunit II
MVGGAAVIWLLVIGLAVHATLTRQTFAPARTRVMVIGGGTLLPTVTLAVLLVGGLSQMPALLDLGPPGGMRIAVAAEQFWWRFEYRTPDGRTIETANEIHLPVGARVPFEVSSPDVIHSFWVPSLAGKIDAIPGRVNRIALEPTRTGVFHGVCAEFCGPSHAHMDFRVVVDEEEAFEVWLERQAADARPLDADGTALFLATGCGACHTVRGTAATGTVGPDLTHVGSRLTLAAGRLDNDVAGFREWLTRPEHHKPGVHMPPFGMLPADEIVDLAVWLEGLQ